MTRFLRFTAILILGFIKVANAQFSDPDCNADLTLWFTAADDGLTKNGSNEISQVNDRSVNGFDVTQSTSSNKPLWVSGVVNGQPVIRFDGNDVLSIANVSSADFRSNNTIAVYAVVRVSGAGTIFNHESSTTAGDGKLSIESTGSYWSGNGDGDKIDYPLSTSFQILHFRVQFDVVPSFGDHFTAYLDGDQVSSKVYPGTPGTPSNSTVSGTLQLGASSGGFSGDLAELIVFDVTHSTEPREQFLTYLSTKYNIPLDHSDVDVDYRDSDQNVLWDLSATCNQTGFETSIGALMRDDCYPYTKITQKDAVEVVTMTKTPLNDDDYFLWGNNGQSLSNNFITTNLPSGVGSYFATQWKVVERSESGSIDNVDVIFDIEPYIDNSHTINDVWVMIDTDDDGLYNDAPGGAVVFNPTTWSQNGGYGTFSYNFNSCDAFTIGFTSNNPLPVELVSFGADLKKGKVELEWLTAQEIDNEKFIVQRSSDQLVWEPIGTVAGMGTYYDETSYRFIDESPAVGHNYYRLKQVDFSGDFAYSPVVSVDFMMDFALSFTAFPNPAKDKITVVDVDHKNVTYKVDYAITDLRGRIVKSGQLSAGLSEINVEDVPSGTYFLILQSGFKSDRSKIVIQ